MQNVDFEDDEDDFNMEDDVEGMNIIWNGTFIFLNAIGIFLLHIIIK